MTAPATPAQPVTYSVRGFTDLVIKHLHAQEGGQSSNLDFKVRGYFNAMREQERMRGRELNGVLVQLQNDLARSQSKHMGFNEEAKQAMLLVHTAFARAVDDIRADPNACEPVTVVKKLEPAKPIMPREPRPANRETAPNGFTQTPAVVRKSAKDSAKPARKPVSQAQPTTMAKEKPNHPLPPEGWVGVVKATKIIRTSPAVMRRTWEPLIEAAQACAPDAQGIRTVPLGDTTVRMLFGGPRKPTWYMHPDDVDTHVRAAVRKEVKERLADRRAAPDDTKTLPFRAPAEWVTVVKACKLLQTSPGVLNRTWKPLIETAQNHEPDDYGIRTVPLGDTNVRMLFGGPRKPAWYMHPDDAKGPLREAMQGSYKRRATGEALPLTNTPKHPQPPEGWTGMVKSAQSIGLSPILAKPSWNRLVEAAESCEPDAQGVRQVPCGDTTVRMLFGGARKLTWYMHPDDVAGPFKEMADTTRRRRPNGSVVKHAPALLAPKGWCGIMEMTKRMQTSPARTRAVLDPLIEIAKTCEPDAEGIRTVPFGDTTVRMLHGGPRKPTWYMHPGDVEGPLRAAVEALPTTQRTTKVAKPKPERTGTPDGYLHYSALLKKLGGDPADLKMVWNGLVYEAERQTPGEGGIVTFEQKEGTVQMWRGGIKNSWHIAPQSYEQVLVPRYCTNKGGLHTDRVRDRLIAAEHPRNQRKPVGDLPELSLVRARGIKPRKSTEGRTYAVDEDSRFEISSIVHHALSGFSGRIPADIEDRIRLAVNRAFADYKEQSQVSQADVRTVIAQCKTSEKNPEMPSDSKEMLRIVANCLETTLANIAQVPPIPVPGQRWQRQTAVSQDGTSRQAG